MLNIKLRIFVTLERVKGKTNEERHSEAFINIDNVLSFKVGSCIMGIEHRVVHL